MEGTEALKGSWTEAPAVDLLSEHAGNQVVIVTTDNGGPIVDCAGIGASNWPLRGGR